MKFLLSVSRLIDAANARLGVIANALVLLSCLISAGNAFSRYAFSISSNAWLEIQWYMFGALKTQRLSRCFAKQNGERI